MSKILANQIANYGDDAPIEIKEGLNIPAGKPIQAAGSAGTSGQVLSTTGASIQWVTPFDGDYNTLINKPNIPSAQVNSDWNATGGVAVILNKPVVPAQPSVTTASAGSAALSYNSTNGEFTFTPPDLSGYLTSYTETDPVFTASAAGGITSTQVTNWDTAYGWGNHASGGYLTSYTETQTLDAVLTLGATTTQDITTTGKVYFSNNFATLGDLPNATTYHGMFAHVHAEGHGYFAHAGAWTQLLDAGSSIDELADVNLSTAPQSGQVLAYDGSNWVATAAGGGGGGIALTDLSVSTASAGTAALSYNNVSGVFTFTPPDLSSYAQTANLTIANWDAAYGWGNHASAGYLVATNTDKTNWDTAYGWGNHASGGYLTSLGDAAGVTTAKISNWDTAYGWGDHGAANYLTTLALNGVSDVTITSPQTNDVLTYNGSGWVNSAPTGGGGGANVTISDTIPAGTPSAGDLWWESDSGRLKVYYTDVDSSQWIDASPPLSYDNINDVISANGFKFRVNESSPPAGTLGELRQIDSKPHFFDGTSWQEFILGSTSAITLPAETAWDNVIVRTTFDNDANDYRFGATGALDTLSFASIVNSTLVESPVKVGTKALKSLGSGVKYPHRSEYLFAGEFTIEFWIYFDDANISSSTNSGEQEIISKSNGSFNAGSWSLITTSDQYGNRNWELKNHDIATNTVDELILEATSGVSWASIYSQQWVHIAITKDNNGALHFYRDGTENSQTITGTKFANDISNNNYDLIIGGGVNTTTNCFDGFIDGLRITTDTRYDSIGTNGTPAFTPPTTILPISGSTTTYTPPATSSAGSFTLGASPAWTGTLGVTVTQQSSGNYRLTFTNPFTNATDYYVFAHHMDGAEAMLVASVRSTGYVDFSVKNVAGSLIDTGSLAVQIIAH